jgi:SAM-dependent methyltransferase
MTAEPSINSDDESIDPSQPMTDVLAGPRTVEEWAAHWNAKASIEDPVEVNGYCIEGRPLAFELYRTAIIEPWLDRLDLEPHHDVLEVGSGSGMLLAEIDARVRRAVGTDFSEVQIARYQGPAETYACAAHELPFQGAQFDRILMASVSHYFPSLDYFRDVVTGLVALLRRPGLLLIGDVLLGPQPATTPYRWYEPMDIIAVLEDLGVRFSIESQPELKRTINRRYDVLACKS